MLVHCPTCCLYYVSDTGAPPSCHGCGKVLEPTDRGTVATYLQGLREPDSPERLAAGAAGEPLRVNR